MSYDLATLAEGIKRANAAGNTDAVKKLGAAYRQLQASGEGAAQPFVPNAMQAAGAALTADPRSDAKVAYDLALQNVKQVAYPTADQSKFDVAAKDLLGPLNPQQIAQNDQLFGFGDEIAGGANALGDMLRGVNPGASFSAWRQLQDARRNLGVEQNGPLGDAASVLGQLTSLGAPGGAMKVAKTAATTGQRALQIGKDVATSGTTGAVMGGVQGFGSTDGDIGQRLQGAKNGAIAGATVGAAAPLAVRAVAAPFERMAQRGAVNAAIKNAPDASDLSSAASQMFKSAKSSGVGVSPQRFGTVAKQLADDAVAKDIDKDLDGPAWTVYDRVIQLAKDGFSDPANLSLSKLHNLRQKAQDVAFDTASKPRTKKFAQDVVDGIDGMIAGLKPGDITGVPKNLLGNGAASGKDAANALLDGISTWAKAKKVGLIESAMNASENYLAGKESGLRSQFKTLLNGKTTKNLWTATERKALQEVINGTLPVRALRTLGMFKGFAAAGLGGGLGSILGPLGTAAGTAAGGAAGLAARQFTESAASGAANRAAKIVATPNIPQAGMLRVRIPYTTAPLLPSRQRQ